MFLWRFCFCQHLRFPLVQSPCLSVDNLRKINCASELLYSSPSSTTNHLKREDSNSHKFQQLYWLFHLIYDRGCETWAAGPVCSWGLLKMLHYTNISHTCTFPVVKIQPQSITATIKDPHYDVGWFSRRTQSSCWGPEGMVKWRTPSRMM